MTEFDAEPKRIGCVLTLTAIGNLHGVMNSKQLEEIDDIMLEIGSDRTGQRIDVDSTSIQDVVFVEYAYQQSILSRSIEFSEEKLRSGTDLEDPYIKIDVATAEFT